jgi:hypothetical protein
MRPFILFAGLAWSAAIHSPLAAAECPAGPPAAWLVGGWTAEKVTVVIRPEGEGLLWSYVRAEGLETRTWGTKATAKAEGRVTKIENCTATLKGTYTEYGAPGSSRRPAVGSAMNYTLTLIGEGWLVGEGIGYGQQPFKVSWLKSR